MSEWQPIETAPKDGTDIIVLTKWKGSLVARWDENACFGRLEAVRPGWQVFDCEDFFYSVALDEEDVVAWMPLPPPPKEME